MHTVVTPPFVPVGKIKSFGASGSRYKVIRPICQLDDGDWLIEIERIETGEKAEYRLTHMQDDPEAV